MNLEQRLRASLVAPDPGAMFTARVMGRVGRSAMRRRTGLILMGTVLAVGAAAATLAWRSFDVRSLPADVTSVPEVFDHEPASGDQIAQLLPETTSAVVPVPPAEPVTAPDAEPKRSPLQYSVLVMPLRQQTQNPAGRGPAEALHASLVDELRKVPGLTLHVQGEAEPAAGMEVDYVVTLTSLVTGTSQSGGAVVRSTDGDTAYVVNGGSPGGIVTTVRSGGHGNAALLAGGEVRSLTGAAGASSFTGSGTPDDVQWVELTVAPRQAPAFRHTVPVGLEGAARSQQCNDVDGALLADCLTPAQLAAAQVEVLRLQVFPPDAAFQQRIVARLGEFNLGECNDCRTFSAGQRKVLQVLQRLAGEGGSRLDAGTIQAIARYAASQPALMRANVWSTLRWAEVSHPALASPLVETLRHDPDQQVRLVALAHLEANYSADPVVRNTLEAVGREDPDDTVRVAASRVLYGEVQWRDEILTALRDDDLPYEARLAPLLAGGVAVSPQQQAHRRAVLREQQVLVPLTTLIRGHRLDSSQAQATSNVLGLLVSIDDPAVFDLFMQLVRDRQLARETVSRPNGIDMSGPVSSWVFSHRDDPRVLQLLSEVDPQLRTMMDQSRPMSGMAVQVPPELAGPPPGLVERMREVTRHEPASAPQTQ